MRHAWLKNNEAPFYNRRLGRNFSCCRPLVQVRTNALLAVAIDVSAGAPIERAEFVLAARDVVVVPATLAMRCGNDHTCDDPTNDRAGSGPPTTTPAPNLRYVIVANRDRRLAKRGCGSWRERQHWQQ